MTLRSILVLHNEPVLPKEHPDAESEHSVVEVAAEMTRILADAGYDVRQLGLGPEPTVLWQELKKRKPDVVFNLYEGNADNTQTESFVAGLLEWSGIPYTGSPYAALSLARAKHTTKYLLTGAGLPTADFLVVNALPVPECTLAFPVIVKPAEQDGSVGVDQESVCTNQFQLEQRVRYILETYGPPVLIEEFIDGREFNVALVELPELTALPPSEITLPEGEWSILTYDGKWKPGAPSHGRADLAPAAARKLRRLAEAAYRLLGCRDYARVDFRMNASGKPYILEVNPNPEISETAGFVGCLESGQMAYKEFIVRLVRQAHTRKAAHGPCSARATPTAG